MIALGQRLSIAISTTAALTSVAVLVVVFVQMDRLRRELQSDGVLEFNFVQQSDHNLDEFVHALGEAARWRKGEPDVDGERWLERYDVLFSIVGTSHKWTGSLRFDAQTVRVIEKLRVFILELEPEMVAGRLPQIDRLRAIQHEALELSSAIYEGGLTLFKRKAMLRDSIASRLDRLTQLIWFFGALFLLAGFSLYVLMARAIRHAGRLASENRSAREQLEIALEEVTTGDVQRKSQNRFLAAATHDLRQPLQALQYYLAALPAHVPGEPGRAILSSIGRSTDAAQAMLTSLLDISRLDAGVLEPAPCPVDLQAMLDRLRNEYSVEAHERGLTLSVECGTDWVRTDPQLLERIIRNLLSNALAYTHEGGISITTFHDQDALCLIVEDSGIGIPSRELEAIFNEYYQLRSSDNQDVAGLGLGLSIVRRLTRLLDVPVRVTSSEGSGTRFELTLPLATPVARPPGKEQTGSSHPGSVVAGLVLLVIDDESEVRDGITTLLVQHGCEVIAAAGAQDACRQLVATGAVPDLILADLQLLGGQDGIEAIEAVREEVNETVPAIIITGDTAAARLLDAERIGVPLLHKPVAQGELFRCIARTLADDPARSRAGAQDLAS